MKTSTTYPRIRRTGRFAVNVLSSHQQGISNQFARKGTDKWADIRWHQTLASNPVLEDTLMWLDCQIWAEHDAGDHVIVLGRVTEMNPATRHVHDPLLYFQGRYRHLGPDGTPWGPSPRSEDENPAGLPGSNNLCSTRRQRTKSGWTRLFYIGPGERRTVLRWSPAVGVAFCAAWAGQLDAWAASLAGPASLTHK